METVAKKKPRPRRSFTEEFKADIVERCRQGDRSGAPQSGQGLQPGWSRRSDARWVEQADIDSGQRDGLTSGDRAELQELRRENKRLQSDVDLLKRAMAFFAKETR